MLTLLPLLSRNAEAKAEISAGVSRLAAKYVVGNAFG
jgi:hypothetical protein